MKQQLIGLLGLLVVSAACLCIGWAFESVVALMAGAIFSGFGILLGAIFAFERLTGP